MGISRFRRTSRRPALLRLSAGLLLAVVFLAATPGDTLLNLAGPELHPDLLFRPHVAGPLVGDEDGSASLRSIRAFRELLAQYQVRQGEDDNFTIRVTDNRTGDLLEVYALENLRERYRRDGSIAWDEVDRQRRTATTRLIDKYASARRPRGTISAKWGRGDQVREAHEADAPYLLYELNLARYLGMSLLVTEIGTVETFNDDRLVSSVGARGRYQMMPYLLKQHGLNSYELRTAGGQQVSVVEYWHPLLTMEPAFTTLRGYINAVGHELPGISAYHAGPGNVFRIFRLYLERQKALSPNASVADAFIWGLTDGFGVVSDGSSFGSYSRGYVPAVYGSLRATENLPVDTTRTFRGELVRVLAGREIYLRQLLRTLDEHRDALDLEDPDTDLYQLFRHLNPHLSLPASTGGVPVRGDVRLTATAGGHPVRFFLPLGSTAALDAAGSSPLNERATFRFDGTTYRNRPDFTQADYDYEALVHDIGRFGFTTRNRTRLVALHEEMTALAREHPTHFRKIQLEIIETHKRLWESSPWERLADAVRAAR